MKSLLAWGILLGWGAAVPIGPVNVEIARRTLRRGFRSGLALGCGAVTVDVGYAVLVSIGLRPVLHLPGLKTVLGVGGAAFLGYLAYGCFCAALREWNAAGDPVATDRAARSAASDYATGLLMTSLNPMTLAFWFLAVPGAVAQVTTDPARDLPWVALGVALGALSWVVAFAGSLSLIPARVRSHRTFAVADIAGGLALAAFAVTALVRLAWS